MRSQGRCAVPGHLQRPCREPEQRYAISHGGLLVVLLPRIRVLVVALEPIRLSTATSYKPHSGSHP
jgi:hypothetical protein